LRMAGVLFQPQAKDGKLAVKESHGASMSRGGMLSSPAALRPRGGTRKMSPH
jgi:hypothetical protein